MRILAPLLILFLWNAAPLDCQGAPEDIVGYVAFDATIAIARWETCVMEDGTGYPCPVYASTPWRTVASLETESYEWPAPTVGLGEIALLDVEQVDQAGNISSPDGCAP